jgi:1-phosphatidylinositol-4-phosphate 5-kinase
MGNITSLQEQCSTGKSGSFFYYTACGIWESLMQTGRFTIKTISKKEYGFFRQLLPFYYKHLQTNPDTLLMRVYGLHELRQPTKPVLYFAVLGNVFNTTREVHVRYDLKGSTVDRRVRKRPDQFVYSTSEAEAE